MSSADSKERSSSGRGGAPKNFFTSFLDWRRQEREEDLRRENTGEMGRQTQVPISRNLKDICRTKAQNFSIAGNPT